MDGISKRRPRFAGMSSDGRFVAPTRGGGSGAGAGSAAGDDDDDVDMPRVESAAATIPSVASTTATE